MPAFLLKHWPKLLAALLVIGLAVALYRCGYDARRDDERAEEGRRVEAATNRAGAEKNAQDARAAGFQANMQGAINNAVQANPEQVRRPVGPATGAALDQLRSRSTPKQR